MIIRPADRHRIGQARLLRRQGKTYDEIRAVIGSVGDERLAQWLKGIARPPETYRSAPKREVRRKCRELRGQGLTYDEIEAITGASVGSMSIWLRDMVIPRDDPTAQAHRLAALRASCARKREEKALVRTDTIRQANQEIGSLSDRDLFLIGVAIYWAEGSKSKPWANRDRITFINSDPTMILVFLRWLGLFGVKPTDCRFRLQIHESADVIGAERFWAELVGVPLSRFNRPGIKTHNPKTVRHNTGETYRGCLTVDVLRSALLYQKVDGWWQGIAGGISAAGCLGHTGDGSAVG